jgi:integrase
MATTRVPTLPPQTKLFYRSVAPANQSVEPRRGSELLTVRLLESLNPGDRVQDTEIGGLYAECGKRGVSLKLAVDVARGKTVRRTLLQWRGGAALDLRKLKDEAAKVRAAIRAGDKPAPKARRAPQPVVEGVLTVGQAIDRYVEDMAKRGCAPRSVKFTSARLRKHLKAWLALPLASVGKSHCQSEHARITEASGAVSANRVLRDFRAVWNLAAKQTDALDGVPLCPVRAVTLHSETGRRDGVIVTDLPGWWKRTGDLTNPIRTLMFRLGLLSGLRPGNLCGIRREWISDLDKPSRARIDFPASVMKGRSGKRRAFTLPLSAPMIDLVKRAIAAGPKAMSVTPEQCEWLFPTKSRDGRAIVSTSNWTEPTLESNEVGHSLRHTYRTMATAAGAPYDVAEMLVAHVMPGVGARYVHPEGLATLWDWQRKISAYILARTGTAAK